jgi:uncharacterized protein YbaP (TraB family)
MASLKRFAHQCRLNFSRTLLLTAALLAATAVHAGKLPLWELEGTEGRVLLMGSVHFLRPSDYPLPAELDAAYAAADTLIMEIDMDDLDPMAAQSTMTAIGSNPNGASLQEVLGESDYAEASSLAEELGIPLALFTAFKPWFAALSITQIRMIQLGFDPAWGIEARMTANAQTEGKTILGLETLEEQLSFMDKLDAETQRLFLLQSLEEASEIQDEVNSIVTAWRAGDAEALEQLLIEGLQETPMLFDSLLTQRNKNWVPKIIDLTKQPGNHLVIVGAMHLIGDNSVLSMLEAEGITSQQKYTVEYASQ